MNEYVTCLDGTLRRVGPNQWVWADGTPEPRVKDMLRNDFAPSFRIVGGRNGDVEIPSNWRDYCDDGAVEMAIEWLIREHGRPADIFAEQVAMMLDEHHVYGPGWRVPVREWNKVMSAVVGCWWPEEHEADILAKAERLREERQHADAAKE